MWDKNANKITIWIINDSFYKLFKKESDGRKELDIQKINIFCRHLGTGMFDHDTTVKKIGEWYITNMMQSRPN